MKVNLIELIKTIEDEKQRRDLSDTYLKENKHNTREEEPIAMEFPYGIVYVMSDVVLPFLKNFQESIESEFPENHWDKYFNIETSTEE